MRKLATITLLFIISTILNGQTYNMSNDTIYTCGGTFYDSGSDTTYYQDDENLTMIFCSENGAEIQFYFEEFEIETNFDSFSIYDGIGISGTPIVYNANSGSLVDQTFISQGSGCLTFVFSSDGSVTYPGWKANISCKFPCQDFNVAINTVSEPFYSTDTIRACQNTPITFSASCNYLNNNIDYLQNDSTSIFHWDFGDGTIIDSIGLTTVSHNFSQGISNVFLNVVDTNGCNSSNYVLLTVITNLTPNFSGTTLTDSICGGELVNFEGNVFSNTYYEPINNINEDIIFIEDNDTYTSSIFITDFYLSDTIADSTFIESICMDIEHAYAGDLQISIVCPNGQSIVLFDGYGNSDIGGEFIGEPTDQSTNPGIPYTYCWSSISTNTTLEDMGIAPPTYSYIDNDSNVVTNHEYLPGGTYQASGDWNNLIGCPLNGEWVLKVIDNMGSDDGYIFNWQIDFDSTKYTPTYSYNNVYSESSYLWSGQNISSQNNGIGIASPSDTGLVSYTFSVTDDFGCISDTTLFTYVDNCTFIYNYTKLESKINVYPNPTIESITIEVNNNELIRNKEIITITDLTGKIVKTSDLHSDNFTLNVSELKSGIYFIKIGNTTNKFIKE